MRRCVVASLRHGDARHIEFVAHHTIPASSSIPPMSYHDLINQRELNGPKPRHRWTVNDGNGPITKRIRIDGHGLVEYVSTPLNSIQAPRPELTAAFEAAMSPSQFPELGDRRSVRFQRAMRNILLSLGRNDSFVNDVKPHVNQLEALTDAALTRKKQLMIVFNRDSETGNFTFEAHTREEGGLHARAEIYNPLVEVKNMAEAKMISFARLMAHDTFALCVVRIDQIGFPLTTGLIWTGPYSPFISSPTIDFSSFWNLDVMRIGITESSLPLRVSSRMFESAWSTPNDCRALQNLREVEVISYAPIPLKCFFTTFNHSPLAHFTMRINDHYGDEMRIRNMMEVGESPTKGDVRHTLRRLTLAFTSLRFDHMALILFVFRNPRYRIHFPRLTTLKIETVNPVDVGMKETMNAGWSPQSKWAELSESIKMIMERGKCEERETSDDFVRLERLDLPRLSNSITEVAVPPTDNWELHTHLLGFYGSYNSRREEWLGMMVKYGKRLVWKDVEEKKFE